MKDSISKTVVPTSTVQKETKVDGTESSWQIQDGQNGCPTPSQTLQRTSTSMTNAISVLSPHPEPRLKSVQIICFIQGPKKRNLDTWWKLSHTIGSIFSCQIFLEISKWLLLHLNWFPAVILCNMMPSRCTGTATPILAGNSETCNPCNI